MKHTFTARGKEFSDIGTVEYTPLIYTARQSLITLYLDYLNNYITVERYAECNGLTVEQAHSLITLSRHVFNSDHPEA
jgi:hypothetical protein